MGNNEHMYHVHVVTRLLCIILDWQGSFLEYIYLCRQGLI